jgi:cytochrome oxidase Cu insertion factor (SCO1/SenC/PrrC family)
MVGWKSSAVPEATMRTKLLTAILGILLLGAWSAAAAAQLPASAGAPKVGEKVPDFTLPDTEGRPVRLSSLHKEDGEARWVLLIFYRGYW